MRTETVGVSSQSRRDYCFRCRSDLLQLRGVYCKVLVDKWKDGVADKVVTELGLVFLAKGVIGMLTSSNEAFRSKDSVDPLVFRSKMVLSRHHLRQHNESEGASNCE